MKINHLEKTTIIIISIVALATAAVMLIGYSAYQSIAPQNQPIDLAQDLSRQNLTGQAPTDQIQDDQPKDNQTNENPGAPAEFMQYAMAQNSSQTVAAANQFAFELYGQYKSAGENIFFSPYSISSVMGMVYEGARNATAQEIQSVFHFPADAGVRIPSFAKLYSEINPQNVTYQLSTANALWAQVSYPFNANYLKTIETYYGGTAANLDFSGAAESSRKTINGWVSEKTAGKITELFGADNINKNTRLVLTNAIYFKGKWLDPFDEAATQEKDFSTASGAKTKCQMMNQQKSFGYAQTDDYQALELPYEKNNLSMIIILPVADKMELMEKNLSIGEFDKIKKSLKTEPVNVSLPKFKFDTAYNMNNTLSAMGMPAAFSSSADFSGMDGTKNLFIDLVVHKAYIDVYEEGTQAAGATGAGMALASIPAEPKIFNADHPFVFAIIHNQSGSILFLGKVNDPTQ